MPTLTSVTKHFPKTREGFVTTLASTIAAGAATVPLNSVTGYTNGDTAVLVVEPGNLTNKQVFTGVVDTAGVQLTGVVWTEGTNVTHTAGATVVDYVTATHMGMVSKGMLVEHNQNGTHSAVTATSVTATTITANSFVVSGAATTEGWNVLGTTLSTATGYNKGNKDFELTTSGNMTSVLTAGMKLRLARSTTPPTQCFDAEYSSAQFATRASGSVTGAMSTFTDDFTVEAWVKLESYSSTNMGVVSRFDGATGWIMQINPTGSITLSGIGRSVNSYNVIPLNQWTHIACALDMSGGTSATNKIWINGVPQVVLISGAGTSITNAGPIQIGTYNSTVNYLDGMIADVRVWNALRSDAQIRDNMHQQLVGNETNLVGYWKLDGNFNDSTTSANNLTGSGGAVAAAVDNPMKATEYGVITKVTASTISVFTGTDHSIPNQTLNAPYYSTVSNPFGFPTAKNKWRMESWQRGQGTLAGSTSWGNMHNFLIGVPTGEFRVGWECAVQAANGGTVPEIFASLSTSTSAESDGEFTTVQIGSLGAGVLSVGGNNTRSKILNSSSHTIYYFIVRSTTAAGTNYIRGDYVINKLYAESAYV